MTGLLYTHSHVDHFGGALGVVDAEEIAAGRIPVLAPEGFLEHAVSENVLRGQRDGASRGVYVRRALRAARTGRWAPAWA